MNEIEARFTRLQASVEATRARTQVLRADSLAILQSLTVTRQELAKVFCHTESILKAVRQNLVSLRAGSVDQSGSGPRPSNAVLRAMSILGRDESDLGEMTDDLIAAFKTASAVGDDEGRALFANALMLIGQHLATQLSPKAAGVVVN